MSQRKDKEMRSLTAEVEIRCPIESRLLSLVRCFARSVAEEYGFSPEEISQIEMAVDEACANVIRHAYKHMGVSSDLEETPPCEKMNECFMTLRVSLGEDSVSFKIADEGVGFARTESSGVSSIEEYVNREGKGGLGLYIINNFMDEVNIETPGEKGTVVTMTKYLKTCDSA